MNIRARSRDSKCIGVDEQYIIRYYLWQMSLRVDGRISFLFEVEALHAVSIELCTWKLDYNITKFLLVVVRYLSVKAK